MSWLLRRPDPFQTEDTPNPILIPVNSAFTFSFSVELNPFVPLLPLLDLPESSAMPFPLFAALQGDPSVHPWSPCGSHQGLEKARWQRGQGHRLGPSWSFSFPPPSGMVLGLLWASVGPSVKWGSSQGLPNRVLAGME